MEPSGACRYFLSLKHSLSMTSHPQVAMHERLSPAEATCGFPGLLKGTKLLGCALITDRGFCRDLAGKYAKAGIMSPKEWCEAHNVLFLWPFTEDDDVGLVYDPTTHRLNIVPKDEAKVRFITSFMKGHYNISPLWYL